MATFYRWVRANHAEDSLLAGFKAHNKSALWVFEMAGHYRPGMAQRGYVLIAYELDETATYNIRNVEHINFEDGFLGESKHPRNIIIKENEPGAYGVGQMRQHFTNPHVRTRYATKKEVAKALNLNEMEIHRSHTPPGGWP